MADFDGDGVDDLVEVGAEVVGELVGVAAESRRGNGCATALIVLIILVGIASIAGLLYYSSTR